MEKQNEIINQHEEEDQGNADNLGADDESEKEEVGKTAVKKQKFKTRL
jgi:hypothetical protein